MTAGYKDIYRGYIIDYSPEIPEPWYCHVLKDGVVVHKAMGYDAACNWIDSEKRKS